MPEYYFLWIKSVNLEGKEEISTHKIEAYELSSWLGLMDGNKLIALRVYPATKEHTKYDQAEFDYLDQFYPS